MIENWKDVQIVPEFCDQGVDCYRLEGGHFLNEYYIVSEAETRKLMNHPEVVGYEVYASLVTATSQMMYYLKEQKKITPANILSILRGALNYPLEESCYKEHIRVHDISFMSSERVFGENDEMSLDIKYCKLTMVPNSPQVKAVMLGEDGVAAPIFDFSGKCIAAISITIIVPLHDRDILEYAEQVVEAAALISSRMGYNAADQQWT